MMIFKEQINIIDPGKSHLDLKSFSMRISFYILYHEKLKKVTMSNFEVWVV